ncbi:MAG TPA: hypothetical protein PLB32_19825 [Acidobacteriota bacterium]|nr:hypothetical protein [Acidobacteriota bacterium]
MMITPVSPLTFEMCSAIEPEWNSFHSLAQVMQHGLQRPDLYHPTVITNVIVQDEFTHDIVIARRDGLVLVLGST